MKDIQHDDAWEALRAGGVVRKLTVCPCAKAEARVHPCVDHRGASPNMNATDSLSHGTHYRLSCAKTTYWVALGHKRQVLACFIISISPTILRHLQSIDCFTLGSRRVLAVGQDEVQRVSRAR